MNHPLTPSTYDEVVSALTGNGELCTTLSPTGYHVAPEHRSDIAHRTQHFVMAGRRLTGPRHSLVDLGTISRAITLDSKPPVPLDWTQTIDWATGAVLSEWRYAELEERTRSFVALSANAFLADTVLVNTGGRSLDVELRLTYLFGDPGALLTFNDRVSSVSIGWERDEHLGEIQFSVIRLLERGELITRTIGRGCESTLAARLGPGESVAISVVLHFSDRQTFQFPLFAADGEAIAESHEAAWAGFWGRSEVITGNELVDSFRRSALYTLRCQATPWSVPPTLSETYWGGGAFHDELYPFFGLLSSNHPDLAARIPYFRLATLPAAIERARGRGALYPWSSTERGEERDPHGLWLTERFHLGEIAVCVHALWLYERDADVRFDLYPVLRELARYFELNIVERDESGILRTCACVDFDESAGAVRNGPFTVSGAIAAFRVAAAAAGTVGLDTNLAARWSALAGELVSALQKDGDAYGIPDGKPLHSAILGPAFPFGIDTDGPRARRSAELLHDSLKTMRGFKPGFSEVFSGTSWMWTAGHLGIVHAMQGEADLAWDAIRLGPTSAGALLSPNEHVDSSDEIHVPWFTTGCGGWLYALNALFVQVDEEGSKLLPAVPTDLPDVRFSDLRAHNGVLVSATFAEGRLISLKVRAERDTKWGFRIPSRYESSLAVEPTSQEGGWARYVIELAMDEERELCLA